MIYRICITTPAGESHAVEVDDRDAPSHACHTALRIGIAQLMHWVDAHVNWQRPDKPEIKTPFHGTEDWVIRMHPAERACDMCKENPV